MDKKKKKKKQEEEEKEEKKEEEEEEEEEEEKAEDCGGPSLASSSSFQLDLFESISFEGAELTHMANAGVPTWTADWCPQSGYDEKPIDSFIVRETVVFIRISNGIFCIEHKRRIR